MLMWCFIHLILLLECAMFELQLNSLEERCSFQVLFHLFFNIYYPGFHFPLALPHHYQSY